MGAVLTVAICADVLRPGTAWFVAAVPRGGALVRGMALTRDAAGFARLRQVCDRDEHLPAAAGRHTLHRVAVVLGAHGGLIAEVTVGDALELLDVPSPLIVDHCHLLLERLDRATADPTDSPATPATGVLQVLPTGFHALDRALAGGLRPGTLSVIGSRPGVGRSTFVLNMLTHAAATQRAAAGLY